MQPALQQRYGIILFKERVLSRGRRTGQSADPSAGSH